MTVSRLILHAQSNPLTTLTSALSLRGPCWQYFYDPHCTDEETGGEVESLARA